MALPFAIFIGWKCLSRHWVWFPLGFGIVVEDKVSELSWHCTIMRKASVGMYHVCDYPYYSCLDTFWHCHPYFTLQFYANIFYTCYTYESIIGTSRFNCDPFFMHNLPIEVANNNIFGFIIVQPWPGTKPAWLTGLIVGWCGVSGRLQWSNKPWLLAHYCQEQQQEACTGHVLYMRASVDCVIL